nr:prephenate dehydrogenase/arogenate dehydrogenase family protein [bacterium]
MKIGIVGLGLIGGSMAKSIKQHTGHTVLGCDLSQTVMLKAKLLHAIDDELTDGALPDCQVVILALYPGDTLDWLRGHADQIAKDTLVVDCCGVKRAVCPEAAALAAGHGFTFIGGHPMAGLEKSGFGASIPSLFDGASMILTPPGDMDIRLMEKVKKLFLSFGFGRVVMSTPEEHDRIIAYTSQLAHVLSSAYIKSPSATRHMGFSAGSFKDMTRVARLNEGMWTELFLDNADFLVEEINILLQNLTDLRDAIATGNADALCALLRDGRQRKEKADEMGKGA